MAAPITHIAVTDKIYDEYFSKFDKKKFYIGTCFADIRYPAQLERLKTHIENCSLRDIIESPDFEAGLKFHNYVDLYGMRVDQETKLYDFIPFEKPYIASIKFYGDYYLYDKCKNMSEVNNYLEDVLEEEITVAGNKDVVLDWHKALQNYFAQKPTLETIDEFIVNGVKSNGKNTINLYKEFLEKKDILHRVENYFDYYYQNITVG